MLTGSHIPYLLLLWKQFCGVDTDNLTLHIQKCSTTVTRVDGCICLDKSIFRIGIFQLTVLLHLQYRLLQTDRNPVHYRWLPPVLLLQLIGITDLCDLDLRHCVIRNIRSLTAITARSLSESVPLRLPHRHYHQRNIQTTYMLLLLHGYWWRSEVRCHFVR